MPAAAAKLAPEADPLDVAEADQEAARGDVARLSAKIKELTRSGPGFDQTLHARLKVELETAFQRLRRVELEDAEQIAAAGAPISVKVIDKIRRARRKVGALHAVVTQGMGECQNLRECVGSLKGEISALRGSWEFLGAQREARNAYLFPRDPEARDNPAPARGGQKTPKSMERLAALERDLETASAEWTISMTAQARASERWRSEKITLDNWEDAVRRLGPAARHALDSVPKPGLETVGRIPGRADFRADIPISRPY